MNQSSINIFPSFYLAAEMRKKGVLLAFTQIKTVQRYLMETFGTKTRKTTKEFLDFMH